MTWPVSRRRPRLRKPWWIRSGPTLRQTAWVELDTITTETGKLTTRGRMRLRPDLYYCAVPDIDLAELQRRGVHGLLIDLDNTLVRRNTRETPSMLREWLEDAYGRGFSICIVSNNWHESVQQTADMLRLPIAAKAVKPLPGGFRRGLRLLGLRPEATATIGDQIFTDVLGGSLIGATTVLVRPLAGGSDLPHTRLLRAMERRILDGREPLGGSAATQA
jgi:HAD superfamily phosphatase (TIGR01668 family)